MKCAVIRSLLLVLFGMVAVSPYASVIVADDDAPADAKGGPKNSKKYELRYKFEANQFVHYEVKHKVMLHTVHAEASEVVRNESTYHRHYRVISVNKNGTAILELVVDRAQMMVQWDENDPIRWDSESEDLPPKKFRDVAKSIGVPQLRIQAESTGKLGKVVRLDTASQQSKDKAPADGDPSQNFLVVFPKEPIGVGETWKDATFEVRVSITTTPGQPARLTRPVKLLRKYKLESVEGDLVTISVRTSVLSPIKQPGVRVQLMQRTPSGTIVFDMKTGTIVSRELKIDKTEIGPFGGKSSMRAVSSLTETLIRPAAIARKDGSTQSQ